MDWIEVDFEQLLPKPLRNSLQYIVLKRFR